MSEGSSSTESLYQISLSIRPGESVRAVAERALESYVSELECAGGAVYKHTDDGYELAAPVLGTVDDTLQAVTDRLAGETETAYPLREQTPAGTPYWLLELPEFGVVVLVGGSSLSNSTLDALKPLNQQLAETCCQARTEKRLREERNRFEAVFETSHEPLVNVVFEDDEPIIKRVNDAFIETFGYSRSEALGANLNDLVVPDSTEETIEAHHLDRRARQGTAVTKDVTRETAGGVGEFRFRAVPVDTTGGVEQFGMYVDITEEKTRRRKLEQLYNELEDILSANDTETICARAITAATEILDTDRGTVYLYDRMEEALVPGATSDGERTPKPVEADCDRVIWEAYDRNEPVRIDDIATFDGRLPGDELPLGSTLIVPLGDHGVLTVSDETANAFDSTDFQFARLLSTLVEIALNRTVRERGLEGIQEITQAALDSNTYEEVARAVVDQVPAVLDLPMSSMWRYDSARNALIPLATTEKGRRLIGEQPTFTGGESIAWEAYENDETRMVSDVTRADNAYNPDSVIQSEIVTPVGEFGVLATGSTRKSSFTNTEKRLVETLASNLETVIRLVSWRQELELLDQVLARVLRHNLRNDLTVIKGVAMEIEETGDKRSAENATHIIERCDALESTANNAREMRQIVRSRDEAVAVDLAVAVENAIETIHTDYPDASLTCTLDGTPTVAAHPEFTSAIRHLIENALEHTDRATPVRIRVFEDEDSVGVEVADDGPGIPDGELKTLRQHGESALEHGSGAGLWIVDRVAEYSDATLEFDTTDGTTVTLRFQT
jgi:PAS domain S-box-containing protein